MMKANVQKFGISSIGLHFPPLVMTLEELAKLRGIDPNKYTMGLGCKKMALCPDGYTIVDLAVEAARRALSRWDGDPTNIGLIAVGTESGEDMSRPLSAWVADKLNLKGGLRSYEVKHACYGGTLALRQAIEWKLAGVAPGKAALVIASDICMYEPDNAAEPTQGAGAVAMIIDTPHIAEIERKSYPYSMPVFDFWHPLHEPFPRVDGQFSLDCYKRAAVYCFSKYIEEHKDKNLEKIISQFSASCFHTPFPKMVKKAFYEICSHYGMSKEVIDDLYSRKVEPTMSWNQLIGNSYTASLWITVANSLQGLKQGEKISAFSYGSGCGAELMILNAGAYAREAAWQSDIKKDFAERREIFSDEYDQMRKREKENNYDHQFDALKS